MPQLVTHTPQYDAVDRVVGFASSAAAAEFKRAATYAFDANGNRTGQTVSLNGAAATSAPSTIGNGSNRQSTAAGTAATTNAAGDLTSVTGKTIQYDTAGRVSSVTAKPVCPIGTSATNCPGTQTTTSLYNGMGQRVIRDAQSSQTVFVYGQDGHTLISQVQRNLTTSAISTTEHIYLPTASGPMPVAAVIAGKHHAVHSDQLNTPRRLTNSAGAPVWQWAYSAFGEVAAQSLPAAGQAAVNYELRYPGQVDDGNGLFYNFHRFYDPVVGRYTQSDPIGLEGGWNRYSYVEGNPLSFADPLGLFGFAEHVWITNEAAGGDGDSDLAKATAMADFLPGSQDPMNSYWHAMRDGTGSQTAEEAEALFNEYVESQTGSCTVQGQARALHALQDSFAAGHRNFKPWAGGVPGPAHIRGDVLPSLSTLNNAVAG